MDDLRHIQGKKITVLGAARSGLAAARLMAERGASVFLSEMDSVENKGKEADLLKQAGIPAEFGGHSPRIYDADLWVVSPGIPPTAKTIQEAKKRSIPIVGELEMASRFCRAPIVAVTGSNGKSTVTALLGEVFHTSGRPCVVAGNIGQPFSDVVEKTVEEGVAVLEVSSFQLETVQTFHPRLAVFLNLTPDHLDRHGTMKAYGQLKARMFENQQNSDILVYNGCDTRVESLASTSKGIISVFGKEDGAADCAFVRDDRLICRVGGTEECILACSEMGIRGEHNVMNGLAVSLAARSMGVDVRDIEKTFRDFSGLPHRMESVRVLEGIEWVNDSKATNVQSVWYALGSFHQPLILIAGGRDKDSDFTVLKERVQKKAKAVLLLGEAAGKMESAFEGLPGVERLASLEEAVFRARNLAESGDVVLLSPACASFDMFQDFEDRGEQFKKLVRALR